MAYEANSLQPVDNRNLSTYYRLKPYHHVNVTKFRNRTMDEEKKSTKKTHTIRINQLKS